jgi:ADP-ribose pyrophosphatase YjhB (NUDIX family)
MHTHEHESPFRFCPCCAGGLASQVLKSGDPARQVCATCGFVLYLDPKVAVGTIITMGPQDGRVVLVRRAIEPGHGLWVFPGGYVDRGEPVEAAALREAREECGLEVRLDGLVNIYSYPGRTPVIIVYGATRVGGELEPDEESIEAQAFHPADIPWTQLAFRSTGDALRDYLAGHLYPPGVAGPRE